MAAIGVFSDSDGDLAAFDAALRLLASKGAQSFLFAGGLYDDVDQWAKWKRDEVKTQADYKSSNFLEDVQNHLIGVDQVDRPAAFGTGHEQSRAIEELARLKDKILRTPEKGSLSYQDTAVPRKVIELLGDTLCCLVHDKNDLDKEDMLNAAILVHGKEPEPRVVQIGPRTFVTPGSLKGARPTVGLFELVDRQVVFSAFALTGELVIDRQPIQVSAGKTKLSVK